MYDLLVIGGGINGAAIARDAAGRGWRTLLVERDDLAQHTSSASSKLAHGGLRYLEMRDFKLVREALKERRVLLRAAPHLARPLAFILPHAHAIRPAFVVRLGLALYDLLAWGDDLPRARGLRFGGRGPLRTEITRGFRYWDGWVDDARLVVLNARDAADRGAEVRTRTSFVAGERIPEGWTATLGDGTMVATRAIVNAAGPWVADLLAGPLPTPPRSGVRLVRGSHIVVPRRFAGEDAYILQQPDGRVVFAIPYEGAFTLIGTTDTPVNDPVDSTPSSAEIAYLCDAFNRYFQAQIAPADVVHSYGGIRALHDDGSATAAQVTRDYHLELDADGPPLLSVFGGKITTARHLAKVATDRLAAAAGLSGDAGTADAPLPGGDLPRGLSPLLAETERRWPFLPAPMRLRLARAYGSRVDQVLGDATTLHDLGEDLGGGLHAREVDHLLAHEWARTADDILWRRTKLGLTATPAERDRLAAYLERAR